MICPACGTYPERLRLVLPIMKCRCGCLMVTVDEVVILQPRSGPGRTGLRAGPEGLSFFGDRRSELRLAGLRPCPEGMHVPEALRQGALEEFLEIVLAEGILSS